MADGSANPYLAVHAVLQAAMLGVEQGYECPAEEDLDCIENVRATRHVPTSLKKAVDALDKDSALRGALGALLVDGLVFLKRDEAKRLERRPASGSGNRRRPDSAAARAAGRARLAPPSAK